MNNSYQQQQEQKRIAAQKKSMPIREYWHLYLALTCTGILTAFAGIYLGLAPSANGDIVFLSTWDMIRRIFFALYYALTFLLVAEGATLFAKDKLLSRDVEVVDGNITDIKAQRQSMTAMLWVSVLAIAMTTVAAGYILASWLHALDEFVSIPTAAQTWVVIGPPALLVFDAVMALIYQQSSKQSELDRWVQQQKRMAEANAQETFARTYVKAYNEVAPEAAAEAAKASAMTDARKWGGVSVQSLPVTPSHDHEKPSFIGVDIGSGPDKTVYTTIENGKVTSVMEKPKKNGIEITKPMDSYGDADTGMVVNMVRGVPVVMDKPKILTDGETFQVQQKIRAGVYDVHKPDQVMEEPTGKDIKVETLGWKIPPSTEPVIPAFEPQHPEENHGTESTEVMEKIPLPDSVEAGADQNSPM